MGEHDEPALLNDAVSEAGRAFRRAVSVLDTYRAGDESGRWTDANAMERGVWMADAQEARRELSGAAERLLSALERAEAGRGGGAGRFLRDALDRYRALFDLAAFKAGGSASEGGLLAPALAGVESVVDGFLGSLETLVVLNGGPPRSRAEGDRSLTPWLGTVTDLGHVLKVVYDRYVREPEGADRPGPPPVGFSEFVRRVAPLFARVAEGETAPMNPESVRAAAERQTDRRAGKIEELGRAFDEAAGGA